MRKKDWLSLFFKGAAAAVGISALFLLPHGHWAYWPAVALTIVLAAIGFATESAVSRRAP